MFFIDVIVTVILCIWVLLAILYIWFYTMGRLLMQEYALKQSIRKWERIVSRDEHDQGAADCKCCEFWYAKRCVGCPIANYVGYSHCTKTPYTKWLSHHTIHRQARMVVDYHTRDLARDELEFVDTVLKNTQSNMWWRRNAKN